MAALYVLIPISLALALGALAAFIWATRKGQFSDLLSPSERLVFEDIENQMQRLPHQSREGQSPK
jgi:cbb3-type cytochrome oxidase maturation protein